MRRPHWSHTGSTSLLAIALLLSAAAPGAAAGTEGAAPAPAAIASPVDFGGALDEDGAFVGAADLVGQVDPGAWTLVSDLEAGEPPRFAPTAEVDAAPAWSAVLPLNGLVRAIAVRGNLLFIGGEFTNAATLEAADYVAVWNGSFWDALGCDHDPFPTSCGDHKTAPAALNGPVRALAVREIPNSDGGWELYVGGSFTNAGGDAFADRIARATFASFAQDWYWDGLGTNAAGTDGPIQGAGAVVRTIAAPASPAYVYIGGSFQSAAGHAGWDNFARYESPTHTWSDEGCGGPHFSLVHSIAYVAGGGLALDAVYVGGEFTDLGSNPLADNLVKCVPALGTFEALGSNGAGNGALNAPAWSVVPAGGQLYVGGGFTNAGGIATADRVARWDGSTWRSLGSDGAGDGALTLPVNVLAVAGADVYAGGYFQDAGGIAAADNVARWNAAWGGWAALGSNGSGNGAIAGTGAEIITALAVVGDRLWVGGEFVDAAGIALADHAATYGPLSPVATLAAPRTSVRPATTAGKTVALRVAWAGSHPAGITRYRLQESVDGGSWRDVPLASATSTRVNLKRAPGRTYRYRVRATNGSGETSLWAVADPMRLVTRQERSSRISYTGTWKLVSVSSANGGKLKYAKSSTAHARFEGYMYGAAWVSTRDRNRGKADVYVDGQLVATLDLRHASLQARRIVFSRSFSAGGYHWIDILVKGTSGRPRVDLDAFIQIE